MNRLFTHCWFTLRAEPNNAAVRMPGLELIEVDSSAMEAEARLFYR